MYKLPARKPILNTKGVVSPLILVGIVSVLLLFVILGNLPIKDKLFGGLFPKPFSQAAGVIDLSLVPDTLSVAKDQTFLADVAIDAKTEQPSAMVLTVKYDPLVLQAIAAEQGFFFTEDLDPTTPKIDNTTGTIQMTLGQKPNQYKTGNGIVATLSFKALQPSAPTTLIQIDSSNTQIAAIGQTGDQLGNVTNSTVTVTNTPAVIKTAEFSLTAPAGATAGNQFSVPLKVKTTEDANLFASPLSFDPALLEVVSIDTTGSFITNWVNNTFDNATGQISLIGGVPAPGYNNTSFTTMATIVFKAKLAGSAQINFGANSAIYRNFDNVDILITPTGATVNITGVAPSPSPSIAPSPSPSPLPSPSPSATPTPTPTPSPSAGASATPTPSPSPTPTPSPSAVASASPSPSASPTACSISQGSWITSANPVNEGKVVSLNVTGTGNCAGQSVSFIVLEDDGALGTDPVKNTPPMTKFNSSNVATSSWLAEFQDDGLAGINNPPEYYFLSQVVGTSTQVQSINPLLQVNKLSGGQALSGDANRDGKVDLVDLSIMLSNWNKSSGFADELDLNEDGVINTVDFATILQILRIGGVIQ